MDTVKKDVRSRNMAAIGAKNTKPEIVVRSYLHRKGLRFSIHKASMPGKPDLYLRKYNTVIFIHGCFWHRHRRCDNSILPKSRQDFWTPKLEGNALRDKKNIQALQAMGFRTIVAWECQVLDKRKKRADECFLNNLFERIISQTT